MSRVMAPGAHLKRSRRPLIWHDQPAITQLARIFHFVTAAVMAPEDWAAEDWAAEDWAAEDWPLVISALPATRNTLCSNPEERRPDFRVPTRKTDCSNPVTASPGSRMIRKHHWMVTRDRGGVTAVGQLRTVKTSSISPRRRDGPHFSYRHGCGHRGAPASRPCGNCGLAVPELQIFKKAFYAIQPAMRLRAMPSPTLLSGFFQFTQQLPLPGREVDRGLHTDPTQQISRTTAMN